MYKIPNTTKLGFAKEERTSKGLRIRRNKTERKMYKIPDKTKLRFAKEES
jgi:hypothetical protein